MTQRPVGRPQKWDQDVRTQIVEMKCPKCGKIFVPAPYHAYKDGGKLYCSWTCYNHRNDKEEKE
jgi:uncharacterized OB-fold protein